MKPLHRKLLILAALVAIGALAWHFGLFRAGDCLLQGGRWNWPGTFCRLDSLAP